MLVVKKEAASLGSLFFEPLRIYIQPALTFERLQRFFQPFEELSLPY
jgi:hypothetical protein